MKRALTIAGLALAVGLGAAPGASAERDWHDQGPISWSYHHDRLSGGTRVFEVISMKGPEWTYFTCIADPPGFGSFKMRGRVRAGHPEKWGAPADMRAANTSCRIRHPPALTLASLPQA